MRMRTPAAAGAVLCLLHAGAVWAVEHPDDEHATVEIVEEVQQVADDAPPSEPLTVCFPAERTVNVDGFRTSCGADLCSESGVVAGVLTNPLGKEDQRYAGDVDVGKVVACLKQFPVADCQVHPEGYGGHSDEVRFVFVRPQYEAEEADWLWGQQYYEQDCSKDTSAPWGDVVTSAGVDQDLRVDCYSTSHNHDAVALQFVLPWVYEHEAHRPAACRNRYVQAHVDPSDPLRVIGGKLTGYIDFAASAYTHALGHTMVAVSFTGGHGHKDHSVFASLVALGGRLKEVDFSDYADTEITLTFWDRGGRAAGGSFTIRVPVEQPLVVAHVKADEPLYIEGGVLKGALRFAGAGGALDASLSELYVSYASDLDSSETNRMFPGRSLAGYEQELRQMRFTGYNPDVTRFIELAFVYGEDPATLIRLDVAPPVVRVETDPAFPLRITQNELNEPRLEGTLRFRAGPTVRRGELFAATVTCVGGSGNSSEESIGTETLDALEYRFSVDPPAHSLHDDTGGLIFKFRRIRTDETVVIPVDIPFVAVAVDTPLSLKSVTVDDGGVVRQIVGGFRFLPHKLLADDEMVALMVKYAVSDETAMYAFSTPASLIEQEKWLLDHKFIALFDDRIEITFWGEKNRATEVLVFGAAPFVAVELSQAEPLRIERGRLTGYFRFATAETARVGRHEIVDLRIQYGGLERWAWREIAGLPLTMAEETLRAMDFSDHAYGTGLVITFIRGASVAREHLLLYPPADFVIIETIAWQPLHITVDGNLGGAVNFRPGAQMADDQEKLLMEVHCRGAAGDRARLTTAWVTVYELESALRQDANLTGCGSELTLDIFRHNPAGTITARMKKQLRIEHVVDTLVEPDEVHHVQVEVVRMGENHNALDVCFPAHQHVGVDEFRSACDTNGPAAPECQSETLFHKRLEVGAEYMPAGDVLVREIGKCLEHLPKEMCQQRMAAAGSVRLVFVAAPSHRHNMHRPPLFQTHADVDCDAAATEEGAEITLDDVAWGQGDKPGIRECATMEPGPIAELQVVVPWNFDYCGDNWVRVHLDPEAPIVVNAGRVQTQQSSPYLLFAGAASMLQHDEISLTIEYNTLDAQTVGSVRLTGKSLMELARAVVYEVEFPGFYGSMMTLTFACPHHQSIAVDLPVTPPRVRVTTSLTDPLHWVKGRLQGYLRFSDDVSGEYILTVNDEFEFGPLGLEALNDALRKFDTSNVTLDRASYLVLRFERITESDLSFEPSVSVTVPVYQLPGFVHVDVSAADPLVMDGAELTGYIKFVSASSEPLVLVVQYDNGFGKNWVNGGQFMVGGATVPELEEKFRALRFPNFQGNELRLLFTHDHGGTYQTTLYVQAVAKIFVSVRTDVADPLVVTREGLLEGSVEFLPEAEGWDVRTKVGLGLRYATSGGVPVTRPVGWGTLDALVSALRGTDVSDYAGDTMDFNFELVDGTTTTATLHVGRRTHTLAAPEVVVVQRGTDAFLDCFPAAHFVGVDQWTNACAEPCAAGPVVKGPLPALQPFIDAEGNIDARAIHQCLLQTSAAECQAALAVANVEASVRLIFVMEEGISDDIMFFPGHDRTTCNGELPWVEDGSLTNALPRVQCGAEGSSANARVAKADVQVVMPFSDGACGGHWVRVHLDPEQPLHMKDGTLHGYVRFAGAVDVLGEHLELEVVFTVDGHKVVRVAHGTLRVVEKIFKEMDIRSYKGGGLAVSITNGADEVAFPLEVAYDTDVPLVSIASSAVRVINGKLVGGVDFVGREPEDTLLDLTVSWGDDGMEAFSAMTLPDLEEFVSALDYTGLPEPKAAITFVFTNTEALDETITLVLDVAVEKKAAIVHVVTHKDEPLHVTKDYKLEGYIHFAPAGGLPADEVLSLSVSFKAILFPQMTVQLTDGTLAALEDEMKTSHFPGFVGEAMTLKFERKTGQKLEVTLQVAAASDFLVVHTDARDPLIVSEAGVLQGALEVSPSAGVGWDEEVDVKVAYPGGRTKFYTSSIALMVEDLRATEFEGLVGGFMRLTVTRKATGSTQEVSIKVHKSTGPAPVYHKGVAVEATRAGNTPLRQCFPARHTVGVDGYQPCGGTECSRRAHVNHPFDLGKEDIAGDDIDFAVVTRCLENMAVEDCQILYPEAVSMRFVSVYEQSEAVLFRDHAAPTCDGRSEQLPFKDFRDDAEAYVSSCPGAAKDLVDLQIVVAAPLSGCQENFVRVHTDPARPLTLHVDDDAPPTLAGYIEFQGAWHLFENEDLAMAISYDTAQADTSAVFRGNLEQLETHFRKFHYDGFDGSHLYLHFHLAGAGSVDVTLPVRSAGLAPFVQVVVDPADPLVLDHTKRLSGSLVLQGEAADLPRGSLSLAHSYVASDGDLKQNKLFFMTLEEIQEYLLTQVFPGLEATAAMKLEFTNEDNGQKATDYLRLRAPRDFVRVSVDYRDPIRVENGRVAGRADFVPAAGVPDLDEEIRFRIDYQGGPAEEVVTAKFRDLGGVFKSFPLDGYTGGPLALHFIRGSGEQVVRVLDVTPLESLGAPPPFFAAGSVRIDGPPASVGTRMSQDLDRCFPSVHHIGVEGFSTARAQCDYSEDEVAAPCWLGPLVDKPLDIDVIVGEVDGSTVPVDAIGRCLQHFTSQRCSEKFSHVADAASVRLLFMYSDPLGTDKQDLFRESFFPKCSAQGEQVPWVVREGEFGGMYEPMVSDCVGDETWPVDLQIAVPWTFTTCREFFVRVHTDPAKPLYMRGNRLRGYLALAGADVYGTDTVTCTVRYLAAGALRWITLRGSIVQLETQILGLDFEAYHGESVTFTFALWNAEGVSVTLAVPQAPASEGRLLDVQVVTDGEGGAAVQDCFPAGRQEGVNLLKECEPAQCSMDPVMDHPLVNPLTSNDNSATRPSPWVAMTRCLESFLLEECDPSFAFEPADITEVTRLIFVKPSSTTDGKPSWPSAEAPCYADASAVAYPDFTDSIVLNGPCPGEARGSTADVNMVAAASFALCHNNFVRVHLNKQMPLVVKGGGLTGYFVLAAPWAITPALMMAVTVDEGVTFSATGSRDELHRFFRGLDWTKFNDKYEDKTAMIKFAVPGSEDTQSMKVYVKIDVEKLLPVQRDKAEARVVRQGSEALAACFPGNSVGVDGFAALTTCEPHVCAGHSVIDGKLLNPVNALPNDGDVPVKDMAWCLENFPARECGISLPFPASVRIIFVESAGVRDQVFREHTAPETCSGTSELPWAPNNRLNQPGIASCPLAQRFPAESQIVVAWPFNTCGANWVRVHVDLEENPLQVDGAALYGYVQFAAAHELLPGMLHLAVRLSPTKVADLKGTLDSLLQQFRDMDWSDYEPEDNKVLLKFARMTGDKVETVEARVPVVLAGTIPTPKSYLEVALALPEAGGVAQNVCLPSKETRGVKVTAACSDDPMPCLQGGVVHRQLANPLGRELVSNAQAGRVAHLVARCLESFPVEECMPPLRAPESVRFVYMPIKGADAELLDGVIKEAACSPEDDKPWLALPAGVPETVAIRCPNADATETVQTQVQVFYVADMCGKYWVRVHQDPEAGVQLYEGRMSGYFAIATGAATQAAMTLTVRFSETNTRQLTAPSARSLAAKFQNLDFSRLVPKKVDGAPASIELTFTAEPAVATLLGLEPVVIDLPVEIIPEPSRVLVDVVAELFEMPGTTTLMNIEACFPADKTLSESMGYVPTGECPLANAECAASVHIPKPLVNPLYEGHGDSSMLDIAAIAECVENWPLRYCKTNVTNLPAEGLRLLLVKPAGGNSAWSYGYSVCDAMDLDWQGAAGDGTERWPVLNHDIGVGCVHEGREVGTQVVVPWNFTTCGENWVRVHTDPAQPLVIDEQQHLHGYLRFAAAEALLISKDEIGQVRPRITVTVRHGPVEDFDFGTFTGDLDSIHLDLEHHRYSGFAGGDVTFEFTAPGHAKITVALPVELATPVPATPSPPMVSSSHTFVLMAKMNTLPAEEWVSNLALEQLNELNRLFVEHEYDAAVTELAVEYACLVQTELFAAGITEEMRNSSACRKYNVRIVEELQLEDGCTDCSVLVEVKLQARTDGSDWAGEILEDAIGKSVEALGQEFGLAASFPEPTIVEQMVNLEIRPMTWDRVVDTMPGLVEELRVYLTGEKTAAVSAQIKAVCPYSAAGHGPDIAFACVSFWPERGEPTDRTKDDYRLLYTAFRLPASQVDSLLSNLNNVIAQHGARMGILRAFASGSDIEDTPAPPPTPVPDLVTPAPVVVTGTPATTAPPATASPRTTAAPVTSTPEPTLARVTNIDKGESTNSAGVVIIVVVVVMFLLGGGYVLMRSKRKKAGDEDNPRDGVPPHHGGMHDVLETDPNATVPEFSDEEMDEDVGPRAVRVDIANTDPFPSGGGASAPPPQAQEAPPAAPAVQPPPAAAAIQAPPAAPADNGRASSPPQETAAVNASPAGDAAGRDDVQSS